MEFPEEIFPEEIFPEDKGIQRPREGKANQDIFIEAAHNSSPPHSKIVSSLSVKAMRFEEVECLMKV